MNLLLSSRFHVRRGVSLSAALSTTIRFKVQKKKSASSSILLYSTLVSSALLDVSAPQTSEWQGRPGGTLLHTVSLVRDDSS